MSPNELMPFRPNYDRIRKQMRTRSVVRKAKRSTFSVLGRLGIDSMPRLILAVFVGFMFFGSFAMAAFSVGLPNPARLVIYAPKESTKVYDRKGVLLYDIFNEKKRTTIPLEQMPEVLKQATIAIEDKDFYHHKGFDVRGLIRGVVLRPLSGRRAAGGSTITQQFVKNALLGDSRTLARKARELMLAFQIEQIYSKDKILELYLNEIPYGNSTYGVQAASQAYFAKNAKDLTVQEAAVLAALPQAPSRYSPWGSSPDLLMSRKDVVLTAMNAQGYITKDELDAAKAAEIKFQPRREAIKAPHFVMYVREVLAEKYGEKFLEEGGFKITTTLDYEKQKIAEEAITARAASNLKNYKASNAALVSLDPNTGEILAMVGSNDYFNTENDGNVNVTIRERQPGSSFKPITYAAAIKKGYGPATMLLDVQTDFGNKYIPRNYDGSFRGPISLRESLANSINVPAVKSLAYAGVKETIDLAHAMGITTLNDTERYGLSLTLGGGEVKPLDLASAYGVFATGGMRIPPVAVLKVEDQKGRVLDEYEAPKPKRALDAQVAYLINNILSDDAARARVFGTGGPLTLPGRTVAAKTGTTNEYRDGWTAGYTPDLVTVVWAGNNNNDPMTAASGLVAAPMWNSYMRGALAGVPDKKFAEPEGIRRVSVDALSGKLPAAEGSPTKTEVFTSWGVPTQRDDSYRTVKVVKWAQDKLAPANFPEEYIETKVIRFIRSERPDNPAWEGPVQAWAKANGMNQIPTETYSGPATPPDGSGSTSSDITITSPTNGTKITGKFSVGAKVTDGIKVKNVEFFYDGVLKGSRNKDPYVIEITPGVLDGKTHRVTVRLTKEDGSTSSASILVVAGDAPPEEE